MKAEQQNQKMANGPVRLAPSILSANFARLGEQVAQAVQAGADRIDVDVMDGHFVPNISFGAPIVQSLRQITQFVEAGSDSFLVHREGNNNLHRTLQRIAICGSGVGASVCANKVPGIRAALIHDHFSARQGVEDDHINILCMGGRTVGPAVAWDLIQTFLAAEFSQAERHLRRLGKVTAQEAGKA